MYKKIPNIGDIVFVKLSNSQSEFGNYVYLVDYDNIEGLVLCTEINKYKSNLKSIVKPDEIFPVIVLNIEKNRDNFTIDLSYSKIKNCNRDLLKNCYIYKNKLNDFLVSISHFDISEDFINDFIENNISNDFYHESINTNTNILKNKYDNILTNPYKLFEDLDCDIKNNICDHIQSKLNIKPYIVEQEFSCKIFEDNSLAKLKELLNNIKNIDTNIRFELTCKSSPIYQIRVVHNDLDKIIELFENIKNKFSDKINFDQNFNIIREMEISFFT